MATVIDDNAAYEKSDKSIWRLLNIRCTRNSCLLKHSSIIIYLFSLRKRLIRIGCKVEPVLISFQTKIFQEATKKQLPPET